MRTTTLPCSGTTPATLSALALTDGDGNTITFSLPFAAGTKAYSASVANDIDEITIAPTANDSNADWDIFDDTDTEVIENGTSVTFTVKVLSPAAGMPRNIHRQCG